MSQQTKNTSKPSETDTPSVKSDQHMTKNEVLNVLVDSINFYSMKLNSPDFMELYPGLKKIKDTMKEMYEVDLK